MARAVLVLLATLALLIPLVAAPLAGEAQPVGKVYRIGFLATTAHSPVRETLWRALNELG